MVRMDRALIYLRQSLASRIRELELRTTKGIGDSWYKLLRFRDEAVQISALGGDDALRAMLVEVVNPMSERTIRTEAIDQLKALSDKIDAYQPLIEGEDTSELKDRIAELEEQLSLNDDGAGTTIPDTGEKSSVFIIMPFRTELTDVWQGGIKRASISAGYRPIRIDTINRSSNITEDIVESINKCHVAIVDVTGNNPNVMFELGYALAKGKPCIIISQSADFLPFDIRNLRTIVYSNTWSGIESLSASLVDFLREVGGGKTANPASKRKARKSAG